MIPTFEAQKEAWSKVPFDEVGYLPSDKLCWIPADELRGMIESMEAVRYYGWRNYQNRWRDVLGLDTTHGKLVLDYGCGTGLEALQYARAGNKVWLADIVASNIALARRVLLYLYDFKPAGMILLDDGSRNELARGPFDIIHSAGVLHHIPHPRYTVELMHRWLKPKGELRLMLYSDVGWRIATDTEPPCDVTSHPAREHFVRFFDAVGGWADWYDRDRLEARFGDLFTVERCEYLSPDDRYLAAVLRRKD